MKRFFALVALVLGLASCQTEPEGLDVQMGGAVDATITVNIPDSETRYGSDSNSAGSIFNSVNLGTEDDNNTMRYILQIYDATGQASKDRQVEYSDGQTVNFDVRLVPDRHYSFVVWADYVTSKDDTDLHYNTKNGENNTTDLTNITLNGTWDAMDETRDAFTGIFNTKVDGNGGTYNGAKTIELKLKRPFAKLRVVTTDMKQLNYLDIKPTRATVEYTVDHYNAFNAFAGKVIGDSKNRDIKHENFEIKAYGDNVDDKSMVLFTDYFFAADEEEEAVNFTLAVYDQNGVIIGKTNNFNTDIAVKRNHLTTIEGNILTDGNKVNVTVEDTFGEKNNQHINYKTISSDKEFLDAVNGDGGKYIVISDLTIADAGTTVNNGQAGTFSTRADGNGTTINLNGYNITLKTNITIAEGKTLTITDINENGETGAIINAGGKIVNNGTLNIEGGNFGENTIENNETEGGKVNITGGTFESDPSELVKDDDYKVVKNEDNNFEIVIKDESVQIGNVKYRSIQKAFDAADGETTIELIADFTLEKSTVIAEGKNITLKLNGKTITGTSAKDAGAIIENNGTLTIVGGTIKNTYTNGDAVINNTGELVLNGVKINGAPIGETGYPNYAVYTSGTLVVENETEIISDRGVINLKDGADVTINGGNFVVTNAIGTHTLTAHAIYAYGYSSKLTINGGHFEMNIANGGGTSVICPAGATIKVYGGNFYHVPVDDVQSGCFQNYMGYGAPVDVYRGTFNDDTVTKSGNIAEGSEVTESNGIWTVSIIPVAQIGATEYDTLQEAFNVGGNITLLRNVTVAETVTLAEGKTAVFDLNGKTLSAVDMNTIKNNGGNLTIKNGTVTRTGDAVGYSVNNASGEIAVENATIERGLYTSGSKMTANNANISHDQSSRHAIYAWNCAVTINSGIFHNDNAGNATLMAASSSIVTINGGTFSIADGRSTLGWTSCLLDTENSATVVINDGTYNGGFRVKAGTFMTINGGSFNDCYGSAYNIYGTATVKGGTYTDAAAIAFAKKYVAEGYEAIEDNGVWNVRVITVAKIGETEYETLEAAVATAQAGDTITLLRDITLAEELALPAGIIFNGNGKQINGKNITVEGNVTIKGDTKIQTLKSNTGCTITIEDGKTLALTNFSFGSKDYATAEYEIKGGTVTANYGFFQHGKYDLRSNFETGYMYYSYGSDITVYGTFHSQGKGDGLDYVRGKLTIANGGKSIHDKSLWVGQPADWGAMQASMVIEEGGYVQANSLSVYEGSSLTYSNDADLKYNSVTGIEYIIKK